MRKLDVYVRIRERCSDSFVEYVTACDCSLKKRDARAEMFFQNRGGKNLDSKQRQQYHRVPNSPNRDERFLELCTFYCLSYVRCFVDGDLRKQRKPLDITAVLWATGLQESFTALMYLRSHLNLFFVFSTVAEEIVCSGTFDLQIVLKRTPTSRQYVCNVE